MKYLIEELRTLMSTKTLCDEIQLKQALISKKKKNLNKH